jgi:hypothetical protein
LLGRSSFANVNSVANDAFTPRERGSDINRLAFFIGATINGNAIRRVLLEAFIAMPPVAQISGDLSTTKRE